MASRLLDRLYPYRRAIVLAVHLGLVATSYLGAYLLRFDFRPPAIEAARFFATLPYLLVLRLLGFRAMGVLNGYWRHVGLRDLLNLIVAASLGSAAFFIVLVTVGRWAGMPRSVVLLDWLMIIFLSGGMRFAARLLWEGPGSVWSRPSGGKRALIVGAGEAGEQLLRQMQHEPRVRMDVVGLIDDDPTTHGRHIHGVRILGGIERLPEFVRRHHVALVAIAIPSATGEQMRRIVERCRESGADFKVLPPIRELLGGPTLARQLRDVQIDDLLGRDSVQLDLSPIERELAGRCVLITGAGGSIGSELARQIARLHPARLILLERAESPLYFIHLETRALGPATDVVPIIASVTNADRLQETFETYHPDYVFHAAAYKHVPMLELHSIEGAWNNIVGTLRVARAAARAGVGRFVLISTDKAVNPTSVLGATKRIAERIVLELPSLRNTATDFRVVRFGNVLGSDGSVVPLFRRQLASGGPLTVTHPEVKRYFMTIPEAVQLVLQAATLAEAAGRIAILEMGTQVRILDLAEQVIRLSGRVPYQDVQIEFTGLRPGEKLAEELVADGERTIPTSVDKIRLIERATNDGAHFATSLRHLLTIMALRDPRGLIPALTELAPGYRPQLPPAATKRRLQTHESIA